MFSAKSKKNHTNPSSIEINSHPAPSTVEINSYPAPLGYPYMYYNYPYQMPSSYQMQQMQQMLPPPPLPPPPPLQNSLYTGYNYNPSNQALSLPSIEKLLKDLDQTHGEGTYTKYSEEFLKEKITVDMIPTLDNDELISLEVSTIGERKILVHAAKFYLG